MTYEKIDDLAILSETNTTEKRLCLIRWNGGPVKLDLRTWSKDGKPLKGCTLDDDEAQELMEALNLYLSGHKRTKEGDTA